MQKYEISLAALTKAKYSGRGAVSREARQLRLFLLVDKEEMTVNICEDLMWNWGEKATLE